MINVNLRNKLYDKDKIDSISNIMKNGRKNIFKDVSYFTEPTFTVDEEDSDSTKTTIKKTSIAVNNSEIVEQIDIISANRKLLKLDSISSIIPYARGKYATISDYIDSYKRNATKKDEKKEYFIVNLAKKKQLVATPNTFNLNYLMIKGISTTGTTLTKTAVSTFAITSMKMLSSILTNTILTLVGLAVTLFLVIFETKRQGSSKKFLVFISISLIVQLISTTIAMTLVTLNYGITIGIIPIVVSLILFFIINQIGKVIFDKNELKLIARIENMYGRNLYAKVINEVNNYY